MCERIGKFFVRAISTQFNFLSVIHSAGRVSLAGGTGDRSDVEISSFQKKVEARREPQGQLFRGGPARNYSGKQGMVYGIR